MSIRLLLVDDQALFREGLRTLLTVYDDLEVVGEAANGEEALRQAEDQITRRHLEQRLRGEFRRLLERTRIEPAVLFLVWH